MTAVTPVPLISVKGFGAHHAKVIGTVDKLSESEPMHASQGTEHPQSRAGIGDNSGHVEIAIEVRAFNSLARYLRDRSRRLMLRLPAGASVADILDQLGIPQREVFLVLCNGRDVSPGLCGTLHTAFQPESGDVIALSGPVPYSWGYGAPVV